MDKKVCEICRCVFNEDAKLFEVSCGRPLSPDEFAKKVCVLRRDKVKKCLNEEIASNYGVADCSWETSSGLDKKSRGVLAEIGVDEEILNELSLPYHMRDMEY